MSFISNKPVCTQHSAANQQQLVSALLVTASQLPAASSMAWAECYADATAQHGLQHISFNNAPPQSA
jgi:hypothetical protein